MTVAKRCSRRPLRQVRCRRWPCARLGMKALTELDWRLKVYTNEDSNDLSCMVICTTSCPPFPHKVGKTPYRSGIKPKKPRCKRQRRTNQPISPPLLLSLPSSSRFFNCIRSIHHVPQALRWQAPSQYVLPLLRTIPPLTTASRYPVRCRGRTCLSPCDPLALTRSSP